MCRLDLSLRRATEEAITLGEVNGVVKHVKLGERLGMCFSSPVLMDVAHCSEPGIDLGLSCILNSDMMISGLDDAWLLS